MKKIAWIVIIILIVLLGASFIKNSKDASGEPIKIGVATVLSGDFASAGENIVKAVNLAIKDVNNSGGISGRPLEAVVEDAGWDSKSGLNAAQKLINVDNIKYIIGGMSSNGTLSAAPLANEKKVIIMTPVTGGKNVDEAGEYIFRTSNSDILAGKDIAEAMIKLGYTKVGVVSEVTEYTLDIKNTFEKTIKDNGGEIVLAEEFQSNTKDYRTLVSKVKAARPQALLVLSQLGTNAAYFIRQSRDLNLQVPMFTDFTLIANQDAKKIVGSFDGIYLADPAYDANNPDTKIFLSKYNSQYGQAPVIIFHALSAYDDVMMLATALRAVGDNSIKVHDWLLANVQDWAGLMGKFSLDKNGNSDLGFVIKQVKGDSFVEIN